MRGRQLYSKAGRRRSLLIIAPTARVDDKERPNTRCKIAAFGVGDGKEAVNHSHEDVWSVSVPFGSEYRLHINQSGERSRSYLIIERTAGDFLTVRLIAKFLAMTSKFVKPVWVWLDASKLTTFEKMEGN